MPRTSTIKQLPDDIRQKLDELLQDPRVSQLEVTERINRVLAESGSAMQVSKSSVNRYSQSMERVGARLREAREVSKVWIGRLGAAPQGEVGKLLNEMVRTLAFDLTMQMADGEAPVNPKLLKELSIAIERLEKAASENQKIEAEIKRAALAEAADKAEKIAKRGGLSADAVQTIRREILGINQ